MGLGRRLVQGLGDQAAGCRVGFRSFKALGLWFCVLFSGGLKILKVWGHWA